MENNKGKRGRKPGKIIFGSYAYHALKIIGGGAALGIALVAFIAMPNLAIAAKPLLEYLKDKDRREWKREQQKLRYAIERLRKRRMIKIMERNGNTYLVVTKDGKEMLKQFEIEYLVISKPAEWDHIWRMVLFDIPEDHKKARDALRRKLLSIGFYPLQKSAFVYPYECRDEIDFITEFFEINRFVQYVECSDLMANEARIRIHFGLLRS
ncbi:MAG: hypothetical protein HYT98_02490 [Candidatus Sungbacteria bacterium]|nr:hypothetical protein [Candidatus Sungbacteria bacterium]